MLLNFAEQSYIIAKPNVLKFKFKKKMAWS